jgi:spore coat-associated protein N
MTIKKKLGIGILTGVMGLSLVGGGTWAAFTDEEKANNSFAAGTLNLALLDKNTDPLSQALSISNMKPGDSKEYEIYFDNIGTLAIKDIMMRGQLTGWQNGAKPDGEIKADFENTQGQFLQQFLISVKDGTGADVFAEMPLEEFLSAGPRDAIALATVPETGLPVENDLDKIVVKLTFENNTNQNKYMGDSAQFKLLFTANQQDGISIKEDGTDGAGTTYTNENGYIKYNENQPYKIGEVVPK